MSELMIYLGTGDYVFLSITALVLLGFFSFSEEITPLSLLGAIALGISLYINYIPYGVYQANISESNGKIIGANTKLNKSFEITIDKEYVKKDNAQYSIPYCKDKSNFYIDVYCTKYVHMGITKMGTVKVLGGEDILNPTYTETMDVDY